MEWLKLISEVGFPIAACACLAVYVKSLTDRVFNTVEKFNEAIDGLTDKVNELIKEARNDD